MFTGMFLVIRNYKDTTKLSIVGGFFYSKGDFKLVSLIIAIATVSFFFSPYIQGRKLTDTEKQTICEKGLYHLTKSEFVSAILDNKEATLRPSGWEASYSNLFRRSTFFFVGMPTTWGLVYNFTTNYIGKNKIVALHISDVEDILPLLRVRKIDGAVFIQGGIVAKADLVPLIFEKPFLKIHQRTSLLVASSVVATCLLLTIVQF